jgi:hypothetical protein
VCDVVSLFASLSPTCAALLSLNKHARPSYPTLPLTLPHIQHQCELVAADVSAKKSDIMKKGAEAYKNYGGQYGFSLDYCTQVCKCCSAPELLLLDTAEVVGAGKGAGAAVGEGGARHRQASFAIRKEQTGTPDVGLMGVAIPRTLRVTPAHAREEEAGMLKRHFGR